MKRFNLRIGGQKWTVNMVSPKSKYLSGGEDCGRCDFDKCAIYIDRELAPSARDDTLLHEILHAALYVSGAKAIYDHDPEKDERLVSSLTPILHSILSEFGFKFPT